MNKEWEMVRNFHEKYGHPVGKSPKKLNKERTTQRMEWMEEEVGEFYEAETLVDQADALIDLIYFALGTMVEMGLKVDNLFECVHKSNMTKILNKVKGKKVQKDIEFVHPEPEMQKIIDRLLEVQ